VDGDMRIIEHNNNNNNRTINNRTTGLERVAEELMGRRKWKQYQESLTQAHTNDLIEKQSPSIGE
jgi:hypothetical protein